MPPRRKSPSARVDLSQCAQSCWCSASRTQMLERALSRWHSHRLWSICSCCLALLARNIDTIRLATGRHKKRARPNQCCTTTITRHPKSPEVDLHRPSAHWALRKDHNATSNQAVVMPKNLVLRCGRSMLRASLSSQQRHQASRPPLCLLQPHSFKFRGWHTYFGSAKAPAGRREEL